jgi:phage-related protein
MATFTTLPSYASQMSEEPRVLANVFGDGYEARVGDGINTILQKWSLTFDNRTRAQADALMTFFRTEAGVTSFTWTPPDESAGLFVAKRWSRAKGAFDAETVTVVFEEVRE